MSVSPSVHLSTIQKVSQSVNKFNSLPDSQSTIQTVSLSIINQATQLINLETLFHQWINHSNSYSTIQKKVDSLLWVLILDAIHDSRFLRESRIKNQERALENIESRIKSRRTENKRLTHDWFLNNFTKTYSCNTTQHGHIHASNCVLAKRPIQVVKRMFRSSRTSVSSSISSNKVSNACSKCKQCLFVYKSWGRGGAEGGTPIWKGCGCPIRIFELNP